MESVIERIRRICKEKGVAVTKMEADLGFGNGYLNPKKVKTIKMDRAFKIAAYLDVPVNDLLGHEVIQETKKAPSEDGELDGVLDAIQSRDDMRALFKTVKDASPEEVKACMAFLTALRGNHKN